MRKEKTGKLKEKLLLGVFTLVLIATFGLSGMFVSYAESQAKVTARSAKIRKEASTSSDVVGGVKAGDVLKVISTVKGSDGKDWYQISFNNVSGYIRSDLAQLTDGSTPPAGNGGDATTPPDNVRPMDPVSATVTRDSGRVRSSASVSGSIVSEVPNGMVLTVTGDVTDSDGSIWYQVNYDSAGTRVEGFIRSDYVTLTANNNSPENPSENQGDDQQTTPQDKPYDTILYEGEWHLLDTATNNAYKIDSLFASVDAANSNANLYKEVAKSEKNQKIIIIVLVFLLVAAIAGIAFLVFKLKDMMDAAYFSEVENDALRKRKTANQGGSQRVMHTVGQEGPQGRAGGQRQPGASQGQRPAGPSQGQRTSGGTSQRMQGAGQGQRPMGSSQSQRAQGAGQDYRRQDLGQGQRMQGTGQRMQGAGQDYRMQEASQDYRRQDSGQGQRMQSSSQDYRAQEAGQDYRRQDSGQGQRMQGANQDYRAQEAGQDYRRQDSGQGQRMQGANQDYRAQETGQDYRRQDSGQGQRMQSSSQRSMGGPQGARPVQEGSQRAQRRNDDQGWQSRNFMAEEEEEFDLEFLNYDEEQ